MTDSTAERLTKLEVEMAQVLKSQEEFKASIKSIEDKLDSLIALKQKGAGAFWLASILMGTGIWGFASTLWEFISHGR